MALLISSFSNIKEKVFSSLNRLRGKGKSNNFYMFLLEKVPQLFPDCRFWRKGKLLLTNLHVLSIVFQKKNNFLIIYSKNS